MTWWMASIVANLCVARVEYVNRITDGGFAEVMWINWWAIALMQWGLYRAWNGAPSFMFGWAFFMVGNMALRLFTARMLLEEPVSWLTLAGVSLAIAGAYLVKIG